MNGDWKTAAEWAAEGLAGLPGTERNMNSLAQRDAWRTLGPTHARKRKGRGGGWEYHVSCLPDAAQADWARRQITVPDVSERLASADAILRRQIAVLEETITELTRRRDAARALLGDQA